MKQAEKNFFKLSNTVFGYDLTPLQLTVYSYLVCTAGQSKKCWPSMKTIARKCSCSVTAARAAADELDRRKFIRKVPTYSADTQGRRRQANNTYYILELPRHPQVPQVTYREVPAQNPA